MNGAEAMRPAPDCRLQVVEHPAGADARARLWRGGRDTGVQLAGSVLELALETGTGLLLFITHDTPAEEQLDLVLLGPHGAVRDRAVMVWPYATGVFRLRELVDDHTLRFDFLGDRPWRLELFDRPRWRLPLGGEPMGVWRRPGLTRWFRVVRERGGGGGAGGDAGQGAPAQRPPVTSSTDDVV